MAEETKDLEHKVSELKDKVDALKDKDRLNLEEIKRLLHDKVDLQSSDISQREKALVREGELRELQASLASSDIPPHVRANILDLHSGNDQLTSQVTRLEGQVSENQTVNQ